MEPVVIVSIVSVCIALASAALSFVTLWRTQFSPFRLIVVAGDLELRTTRDAFGAYINMIVPITVANVGARVGRLRSARIDLKGALPQEPKRYVYVLSAEPSEPEEPFIHWSELLVLPKESTTKELRFSCPMIPLHGDNLSLALEVYTDERTGWYQIAQWRTTALSPEVFQMLAEYPGTTFGMPSVDAPPRPGM